MVEIWCRFFSGHTEDHRRAKGLLTVGSTGNTREENVETRPSQKMADGGLYLPYTPLVLLLKKNGTCRNYLSVNTTTIATFSRAGSLGSMI